MIGKTKWNDGWEFGKVSCTEKELSEQTKSKQPEEWMKVDVPHDWLIYNTQDLYEDSIGWYRKQFEYQKNDKLWMVEFEAIYMDATVYINGKVIEEWKYGYSTFSIDLTEYLTEGMNEIKVRVLHFSPNSRWYSGAGIYRNVWLVQKMQTRIVENGVYITPISMGEKWNVEIDTQVCLGENHYDDAISFNISYRIFDEEGKLVASLIDCIDRNCTDVSCSELNHEEVDSEDSVFSERTKKNVVVLHHTLTVTNPKLWDIGAGNRYQLQTELSDQIQVLDHFEEKFGFRTIHMDPNEGFFLNGKHVKINGSCEHHGFGCLGGVANKAAIRKKLVKLREMGVNAIRTAHNMPSRDFMELADEMGFLVNSEAFDMWGKVKTTYDYGRFFKEWVKKDVESWICRDRNHPSIIMWSLGNEIYDLHEGSHGLEELKMLIEEVKKHDPKKHAKITFASNYLRWENTQNCADWVDAVGYNYTEDLYQKHHEEHPEWVIYGSETASMLASRNVYHFPLEKKILCEDNQQCSALGNCFAGWGAHNYLDNILKERDCKFSLGQFIWTGFDYFGEPTPYHTKNSYFGQIDTAGFAKDSFYIYQAEWTDYKVAPMVHVFPYWDFNIGQIVDVCVCSNAPVIELFLNGKSLGKKILDHKNGSDLVPSWSIPYEKGVLCAVAYDENGQVIAKEERHSFGDVSRLEIKADKTELGSENNDLIFLEITAQDSQGYIVENANNRVQIEVSGAGRLVGIDNGDSTDFDQVKGKSKRLFGGKLLAVVAARGNCSGPISVSVTSQGIKEATIQLYASEYCQTPTYQENELLAVVAGGIGAKVIEEPYKEIPIRKIELLCEEELLLTNEKKTLKIKYQIYPLDATYRDLAWKIVDDTGIEVSMATLEIMEEEVMVHANKDGKFQLRCVAMNGGTVVSVRSSITIQVQGVGTYLMNPYEKIVTGLCKERPEGLSEGIDHGVRFLGKEDTYISFSNLDFGTYGTESIQMDLFKYMDGPVQFQIETQVEAEGMIKTECLLTGSFSERAEWMQFKEQTYQLSRRIYGIQKIGIRSRDNFQLKTIQFIPVFHGLEQIKAIEFDDIYGDAYDVTKQEVANIGNNVTLRFKQLCFGNRDVTKLVICGRSKLSNNSIHVKIEKEGHFTYELIEFEGSTEYVEREYEITPLSGEAEVQFVFLPGSQFDFLWFHFC